MIGEIGEEGESGLMVMMVGGGVEGEKSSSSFRLMSDGCGHLIDDGEEEIVGRNWEVVGGEEIL